MEIDLSGPQCIDLYAGTFIKKTHIPHASVIQTPVGTAFLVE